MPDPKGDPAPKAKPKKPTGPSKPAKASSKLTPKPTKPAREIDDEAVWNRMWALQGKREEGSVTSDQLYDLWPDLATAKRSYIVRPSPILSIQPSANSELRRRFRERSGRRTGWLLIAGGERLVVMAIWNLDEGGKWKSEAGAEGPPPNLPPTNAAGLPWAEGDKFDDAAAQPTALTSDQAISLTGGFAAPARGDVKDHGRQGGVALTSDKAIFRTGGFAAPAPLGEVMDHGRQAGLSDNKGPGLSGGVALTSDQDIFRTGGLVGTDKGTVRSGG